MDSRSILRFPSVCMYNHVINIQHYHTKSLSKPSFLVQAPRHARHTQGFLNNSAKSIGLWLVENIHCSSISSFWSTSFTLLISMKGAGKGFWFSVISIRTKKKRKNWPEGWRLWSIIMKQWVVWEQEMEADGSKVGDTLSWLIISLYRASYQNWILCMTIASTVVWTRNIWLLKYIQEHGQQFTTIQQSQLQDRYHGFTGLNIDPK